MPHKTLWTADELVIEAVLCTTATNRHKRLSVLNRTGSIILGDQRGDDSNLPLMQAHHAQHLRGLHTAAALGERGWFLAGTAALMLQLSPGYIRAYNLFNRVIAVKRHQ